MTIEIKTVSVSRLFVWYKRAWQMFKEQPGLWMFATMTMFGVSLIAMMLDVVGIVLRSMIMPFFIAGFYHLAFRANHKVGSKLEDFFAAFKDKQAQAVLLQIGLVGVAFSVMSLPSAQSFSEALAAQQQPADADVIAILTIHMIHYIFTFFAIPIAFFHHERSLAKAVLSSIMACLRNIPVLALFAISASFISAAAFMLTLGMAMAVVMPWLMIVSFLAFNDIIGGDFNVNNDDDDNNDMTIIA